MRWLAILCMAGLGAACSTGNASYVAPSPSNFKPFSKPAPLDRWSTDCEIRCRDESLRKAHISILRWQGEPPNPDGCSQVDDGDLKRTCESADKGACLRCGPWKIDQGDPGGPAGQTGKTPRDPATTGSP